MLAGRPRRRDEGHGLAVVAHHRQPRVFVSAFSFPLDRLRLRRERFHCDAPNLRNSDFLYFAQLGNLPLADAAPYLFKKAGNMS